MEGQAGRTHTITEMPTWKRLNKDIGKISDFHYELPEISFGRMCEQRQRTNCFLRHLQRTAYAQAHGVIVVLTLSLLFIYFGHGVGIDLIVAGSGFEFRKQVLANLSYKSRKLSS